MAALSRRRSCSIFCDLDRFMFNAESSCGPIVACATGSLVRVRLLGTPMKARRLIETACYDPDQVKALGQALDDAWARIAPSVNDRPEAIDAARFTLADIILGLAKQGNFDSQWLADTAVQLMLSRSSNFQP